MQVSKAFRNVIRRKACKGLVYDQRLKRLRYDQSLSQRERAELISIGISQYGYNNKDELNRIIESVACSPDLIEAQETLSSLCISDLAIGDIVELGYDAGSRLTLISVRRGVLVCVEDNNGDLRYGDHVKLLNLRIERGAPAYMRIERDGIPYPDNERCYSIDVVGRITVFRNVTSLTDEMQVNSQVDHINGAKVVYALTTNSSGRGFSTGNLTIDAQDGLFVINLLNMTFELNVDFITSHLDNAQFKQTIVSELNYACQCDREIDNLSRVQNVSPGQLMYRRVGDGFMLEITQYAKIKMI